MKKLINISLLLTMVQLITAQPMKPEKVSMDTLNTYPLRSGVVNNAFAVGEKLTYRVHYGFVDAGEATIEVKESKYKFDGRPAYHMIGKGRTLGAFNWFFKVRDHFETYIDKEGLFPHRFIRDCNEGGYIIQQDYTFEQKKRAVKTQKGETFATPASVQDMISGYFYARTVDYSNAKKGDIFTFSVFMDDELFPLQIRYMGTEVIKVRAGKYRCMRFQPVVQEGRVFKSDEDLSVWITDDENKIPILIKSDLLVGSIKMEVVEFEGLANPVAKVD
jgi:hypothetical protein